MEGFVPLLSLGSRVAPKLAGIYVVLRESSAAPVFEERSLAGLFKGVDSTVDRSLLQASWVDESEVLYIGKASWGSKRNGIRRRLSQYRRHGSGKAVGHRGGEFIWQLADSADLLVCWIAVDDSALAQTEADFIASFKAAHGRWPFANRKG